MHKTYFFEISAREGREIFHVLRWNSLNKMRVHGSKRMQDVQFSGACGGLTEKQCFHNVIIHDKIFSLAAGCIRFFSLVWRIGKQTFHYMATSDTEQQLSAVYLLTLWRYEGLLWLSLSVFFWNTIICDGIIDHAELVLLVSAALPLASNFDPIVLRDLVEVINEIFPQKTLTVVTDIYYWL